MTDMQAELDAIIAVISTTVATYGLQVVAAVLILVFGWIASGWVARGVDRGLSKIKACEETLRHFFSSLAKYAVLAFTVVAVLEKFGVQTTSFVAILGAAGLAIGLAMQGTLSNVAAGVMLLFFRPFKVGDYIEGAGIAGTVKSLSLFLTELATPDNVRIIIPNAKLWNEAIKNYSANPTRRIDLAVGISYSDDIDAAMAVLETMVNSDARILRDPAPMIAVTNLGESSVDLMARVWVNSGDYWNVKFDMNRKMKMDLDAAGISIPFPQRDVHVHTIAAVSE